MTKKQAFHLVFILYLASITVSAAAPGGGKVYAPSKQGRYPAVIVLHTKGGLRDDEGDFARRLSKQGYVALTVDYFSGSNNIAKGHDYLKTHPKVDPNRVGLVGFSMGGRMALDFSSDVPTMSPGHRISGIVNYYIGNHIPPWPESVEHPPVLFLHGDRDQELHPNFILNYCKIRKQRGAVCEAHIYKGVYHAFDRQSVYGGWDGRARADAWKRAVAFLDKYVKGDQ